ncbi:MAG TPA: PQQ-binding-like beta-propeller repeat protein [Terriglobia bacterium]|nr:PQQ-binding-like beta-propeller repeat protein [Terriglobia bacterium]
MMKISRIICGGAGLIFLFSVAGAAQNPGGAALFQKKCSVCHHVGNTVHAPSPESLHHLSEQTILSALETGVMKAQGSELSEAERVAVAQFLSRIQSGPAKTSDGYCGAPARPLVNDPGWTEWGVNPQNTRSVPATIAQLNRDTVPKLRLKWAFGFRGAWATFGQPTVFGGRVFAGSEDGHVYSLDAKTGCIYWIFKAPATVKTAIPVGLGGRVAFFGDVNANVYAVNASTGSLIWEVHADPHSQARITGSPVLDGNRLYVPVSSGEEGAAIDPKYPCCTFRGNVVALNALTGKRIWKAYTIPDASHPTGRKNPDGTSLWGPSGGSVWSAPAIDLKGHAIYVATGNSYSDPPSAYTDAIIAFSIETGKRLWSRQLVANDVWNTACVAPDKANCPPKPGRDFDFGAAPILRTLPNGQRLLLALQKSGVVYALDPDHRGRIVWQVRVGKGGPLGGIQWGGAADQQRLYVPLADWSPTDATAGGGLFALQLATGRRVWYTPPSKPACLSEVGCNSAQSAPTTLIPGVVFSGSEDGTLRAYDTRTGNVIWQFNDLREFQTVNGVKARGGSMDATGPAIAGGMLYVDSGYTNEISGNVLLAFSVEGK